MKIAIVFKVACIYGQVGDIAKIYDGPADRTKFPAELGWESHTEHVEVPEGAMEAALDSTFENDVWAVVENATKKAAILAEAPKQIVKARIAAAMSEGQQLILDFATENVLLGITQDGMTGIVSGRMANIFNTVQTGSFYEAIARIKALPAESKDPKFLTNARLLSYVNRLERWLGITESQTL